MYYFSDFRSADLRWVGPLFLSFSTTLMLFFIMKNLVTSDQIFVEPDDPGIVIELIETPEMGPVDDRQKRIIKPDTPVDTPAKPPVSFKNNPVKEYSIGHSPTKKHGTIKFGLADGPQLPIMTVLARYPRNAIRQNIEGYVIVEFDINELGQVINPRVSEGYPSAVFNKSALEAIQRFKFKPKVINGEAEMVYGVLYRFTYELGQGQGQGQG